MHAESISLKMKDEKKIKIIALETSWIPEEQFSRTRITNLLNIIERLPGRLGMDNIKVFCARGEGLEGKIQKALEDAREKAERLKEPCPELEVIIAGREEDIIGMRKTFKDAILAKMDLSEFAENGDTRIPQIIQGLLSANPNNSIVIDEFLTIEPDPNPNNRNSYIVRLKAEPIDMDADRDIYFLYAREIETRA